MTNPAPSRSPWTRTFTPVFTRNRHDGWTKQKQVGFIDALAETACVTDACRAVGMSTESAYTLRRRYDARCRITTTAKSSASTGATTKP